jgi:hypothetical protein
MTWTEKKFLFTAAYAAMFALAGKITLDQITDYSQPLWVLIKPGILSVISILCLCYDFHLLKKIKKDLLG